MSGQAHWKRDRLRLNWALTALGIDLGTEKDPAVRLSWDVGAADVANVSDKSWLLEVWTDNGVLYEQHAASGEDCLRVLANRLIAEVVAATHTDPPPEIEVNVPT
jgi:hypothetical protein